MGRHLQAQGRQGVREARDRLGRGRRRPRAGRNVLGVSHDPDRLLPASLVATQDIRIDLPPPGPRVLRAAIELVTGMRPRRVPQGAARGLTFDEVSACLRRGSRPSDCVRRLVAASQAKLRGDVALNDVPVLSETHGYGEAADWGLRLAAAVEEWRHDRRNFSDLPEKCAVFSGPAGVGKSSYVRSLAKTLGMPLVATSVAAWFTAGGYLDQVIKAIDAVFAQAASLSPAVLFLDEIDAIPNRSRIDSRHAEYWIALTSHILTKLDSATSGDASRLVVVGATNFPERLDEALVRPGRLNRVIPIHMPDQAAVAGILRQHLGDDLPGADLAPLAVVGLAPPARRSPPGSGERGMPPCPNADRCACPTSSPASPRRRPARQPHNWRSPVMNRLTASGPRFWRSEPSRPSPSSGAGASRGGPTPGCAPSRP